MIASPRILQVKPQRTKEDRMKTATLALAGALGFAMAACAAGAAPGSPGATGAPVTSAAELVSAMHDRYASTWYSTLRFRQNVIRTRPDGTRLPDEVWLEHAEIPGKLRIDLAANYNGNAQIYSGDSVFVFQNGAIVRRLQARNPLMVLGFDVYRQPVSESLRILQEEGFDLTKFRVDSWQGRPAYVVGAVAGDTASAQFWIDRERLVFTRLIQRAGPQQDRISEIQFNDYAPLAGGWIAPTVVFLLDGRETMRETYFDMEANVKLPAGIFDPERFGTVRPN